MSIKKALLGVSLGLIVLFLTICGVSGFGRTIWHTASVQAGPTSLETKLAEAAPLIGRTDAASVRKAAAIAGEVLKARPPLDLDVDATTMLVEAGLLTADFDGALTAARACKARLIKEAPGSTDIADMDGLIEKTEYFAGYYKSQEAARKKIEGPEGKRKLAQLYWRFGQPEKAVALFNAIIAEAPGSMEASRAALGLRWVYSYEGKPDEAAKAGALAAKIRAGLK
ncbi:MAG: tetratricopeptide repeat protein [bacterium]|nr:tetratricopeptide repeat protein [bacterium]